ncbi:MAG: hypothetical protein ACNA7I_06715 [Candidatus Methanoperedens sp.]
MNLSDYILVSVIPIVILTFVLLMYVVIYLFERDPDIIRSRIFLNYHVFKKAFIMLAIFALVLIFHVSMIFKKSDSWVLFGMTIYELQIVFGMILAIIICFVSYFIYKAIK